MAAPEFVPVPPKERVLHYASPDYVPEGWKPDRPGDLPGRQPSGPLLGHQGPDQGYALVLAERFRDRLHLTPGEHADDALAGAVAIGLRRASLFGRAPVIHDIEIGLRIWGFLDPSPPTDLVEERKRRFACLSHGAHYYAELRELVDMVPEETLRSTPAALAAEGLSRWRERVGLSTTAASA